MAQDDWRLTGNLDFLLGATLVFKKYWNRRPDDDHDHCEFCWAKFMVVPYADDQGILTEGFAVQDRSPFPDFPNDYWWVCQACAHDFAMPFGWTLVGEPEQKT